MQSLLPRRIAVIGTAGRDKAMPLTKTLWNAMTEDLHSRIHESDTLVSGGAAWADHLAVHAYLQGWCQGLALYLPAPFQTTGPAGAETSSFVGLGSSSCSASAANWYHQQFRKATGVHGMGEIHQAIMKGAELSFEPSMPGYAGMLSRNRKVARTVTGALAYTFGPDSVPMDGGTKDTWQQIKSVDKMHIPLMALLEAHQDRLMSANEMAAPEVGLAPAG